MIKYLIIFLFFTLNVFAQHEKEYVFENGYVLKGTPINDTDNLKFDVDSVFTLCGRFVKSDYDIKFIENNKNPITYYIEKIEKDEKTGINFYYAHDVVYDKRVVIYINEKDQLFHVSQFIDNIFYIYIYILKPIR